VLHYERNNYTNEKGIEVSIKVMNHVWKLDLPARLKYTAIALADHAHDDGTEARPSQDFLAEKTGISVRQIRRNLKELAELGVIKVQRPAGRNRATCFEFNWGDTHVPSTKTNGGTLGGTPKTNGGTYATQWGDTGVPLTIRTVIENKNTPSTSDDETSILISDPREAVKKARELLAQQRRER
jgi:hypothetical protein